MGFCSCRIYSRAISSFPQSSALSEKLWRRCGRTGQTEGSRVRRCSGMRSRVLRKCASPSRRAHRCAAVVTADSRGPCSRSEVARIASRLPATPNGVILQQGTPNISIMGALDSARWSPQSIIPHAFPCERALSIVRCPVEALPIITSEPRRHLKHHERTCNTGVWSDSTGAEETFEEEGEEELVNELRVDDMVIDAENALGSSFRIYWRCLVTKNVRMRTT
ncbi:hypothetical protein FA95DRAFT_561720 [Auriscalpium vulgare]|uniref:Uncharacterized protein n=1 Tax=Auriscalpium vulgare TaxID=40419 RepID=A0ACB8REE6_9AGAM|nr:hypothetical protein FA95DRAFT_561720 [Auriscalpium vulgare]